MQQTDSKDSPKAEETGLETETNTENQAEESGAAGDSAVDSAETADGEPAGEVPPEEPLADWVNSLGGEEDDPADEEQSDPKNDGLDAKTAELEAQSAELAAQLADTRDQLLRKAADFENFRKRMNQEKQSAIEFANQTLLLDIIPVIDDFERAIQSAEASAELVELPAGKALLDGITMIEKRLTGQLEGKWGLKRFNSAGEVFDPNRHEAMMMEKSPDVSEAIVQEDLIKGYTLKERVIRAAKVKVLMPEEDGAVSPST